MTETVVECSRITCRFCVEGSLPWKTYCAQPVITINDGGECISYDERV